MSMLGFLTLTGDQQGAIEGSSTHEQHENDIEVLKFDHQIAVPSSVNTAMSSGQVVHGGIKINKLIDKSTPKLAQALDNREVLTTVEICWFRHTRSGEKELAYKVKLENALITQIKTWSPHFFERQQDEYQLMEDITFSYEKILWSWGRDGDVEYETQAKGAQ